MITANINVLEAIKSFKESNDPRWVRISEWISNNAIELSGRNLHDLPDYQDANWTLRHHTDRGFAAALDVLRNIFLDVDDLLAREKRAEAEFNKLMVEGEDEAVSAMS